MNKVTRVLAWIYIALPLCLPVLIGLAAAGVFAWSMVPEWTGGEGNALFARLLASGAGVVVLVWAVVATIFVLPWVFLLRKQAWAWWVLVVWFSLGVLLQLLGDGWSYYGVPVALITLVILLMDQPGNWRSRSKGTRRRRRSTRRRRRSGSSRSR